MSDFEQRLERLIPRRTPEIPITPNKLQKQQDAVELARRIAMTKTVKISHVPLETWFGENTQFVRDFVRVMRKYNMPHATNMGVTVRTKGAEHRTFWGGKRTSINSRDLYGYPIGIFDPDYEYIKYQTQGTGTSAFICEDEAIRARELTSLPEHLIPISLLIGRTVARGGHFKMVYGWPREEPVQQFVNEYVFEKADIVNLLPSIAAEHLKRGF